MLLWLNILLATQCFGRLCQSPRHCYSRKLHVWLRGIYTPWFMTTVLLTYTPIRQALTKAFPNSNLVNIICLPCCHFSWLKSLFLRLKKTFRYLQEKRRLLGYVKTSIIFFSVVFKRNDHCNNNNSFRKGVTQQNHFFYRNSCVKWGLISNCCFIKWASNSVEKCLKSQFYFLQSKPFLLNLTSVKLITKCPLQRTGKFDGFVR